MIQKLDGKRCNGAPDFIIEIVSPGNPADDYIRKLYYYKKENATLEEDFFIRSANNLIPVEVKAQGGRSKSLRTLISSDKYSDIAYGFKLSANNIGYSEQIYTFPYFCTFLLKRFMATFKPIEENQ